MPEKVNGRKKRVDFCWTDDRLITFMRMREAGNTYDDICALFGENCTKYTCQRAHRLLVKRGWVPDVRPRRGHDWTVQMDDRLTELYVEQGLTAREIGEEFGKSHIAIQGRIQRLGLQRKATTQRTLASKLVAEKFEFKTVAKSVWTVRTDRQRAKLYNGCRYEDADVPKMVPRCGRLG